MGRAGPSPCGFVGVDPRLVRVGAIALAAVLMIPVALALREDGAGELQAAPSTVNPTVPESAATTTSRPSRSRPPRWRPRRRPPSRHAERSDEQRPRSWRSPSNRPVPGRTPSCSTTSGTASRSRRAPASTSGWSPTTPRPTRRCTSATSCASPPVPLPRRPPPTTTPAPDDDVATTEPPATTTPPTPAPVATEPATTPAPAVAAPPATPPPTPPAPAPADQRQRRGTDPRDLARRPRGPGGHDRQARERPAAVGQQLVLLRRLRHLLRDGQELARRPRRHVCPAAVRRSDEHPRRRTICTRSLDGRPWPQTDPGS